jgi:TPR repeat protein
LTSSTRGKGSIGSVVRIRVAVGIAIALACALHACRSRRSYDSSEAPSATVATIAATIGACDDPATCARECDEGSADRCRRLAVSYVLGQGVDRDEARATGLYERACTLGDPSACVFAGQMYEYAHGVPKDDGRAASLYARACGMAWIAGCYNLGIMYEHGRGVPTDRSKAADLYDATCKAGVRQACDMAREMRKATDAADSAADR